MLYYPNPEPNLNPKLVSLQGTQSQILIPTHDQVFGLHANAEITYLSNAAKDLVANLIELQPRSAASGA